MNNQERSEHETVELPASLLRRVLAVMAFNNTDELFWREDGGILTVYAKCSDFFGWGMADLEPIEKESDVALLEAARDALERRTSDKWPMWIGELYATWRRRIEPASFMLGDGKYALPANVQPFFTESGWPVAASSGGVS